MNRLEHFSVQAITDLERTISSCVSVEALGPVQAAELVLGETLVTSGEPDNARAIVWKLADDFSPVSVKLFRAPV